MTMNDLQKFEPQRITDRKRLEVLREAVLEATGMTTCELDMFLDRKDHMALARKISASLPGARK